MGIFILKVLNNYLHKEVVEVCLVHALGQVVDYEPVAVGHPLEVEGDLLGLVGVCPESQALKQHQPAPHGRDKPGGKPVNLGQQLLNTDKIYSIEV